MKTFNYILIACTVLWSIACGKEEDELAPAAEEKQESVTDIELLTGSGDSKLWGFEQVFANGVDIEEVDNLEADCALSEEWRFFSNGDFRAEEFCEDSVLFTTYTLIDSELSFVDKVYDVTTLTSDMLIVERETIPYLVQLGDTSFFDPIHTKIILKCVQE